jgi:RNA methyltransferase, TrmH family
MNEPVITSVQNPLVKQVRKLHQAKERHQRSVCLLEGTNLIQAACQVNYPLQLVCYTEAWQQRYPSVWEQVHARASQGQTELRWVSPEVLAAMATTMQPDGILAIAPRQLSPSLAEGTTPPSLGIIGEYLQDPGNLGTIIRTGVAAGCDRIYLSANSVDFDHPKVLRASAGQWFHMPMQVVDNISDLLREWQTPSVQGSPLQIVATTPTAHLDYWDLDLTQPTVFLIGNEGAGLSAEVMAQATHQVKIPVAPVVESLNVAIATALLLYEAKRQRR